ncbi:MAG TPA: hypothetical protein VEO74_08870, partial [Thermoanaerobaculia bacterium]|nr:hypothetical protein [Thermoanaerobaculia bacterium]
GGSIASRLVARLPEAGKIFAMLNVHLHEPWFWAALLLGIVAAPFVVWRRERFVLLACLFQIVFYIGAYFVTPYDPAWHIGTSWPRLTVQIAAPLTYTVMIALANTLRETNAEARSEQP